MAKVAQFLGFGVIILTLGVGLFVLSTGISFKRSEKSEGDTE